MNCSSRMVISLVAVLYTVVTQAASTKSVIRLDAALDNLVSSEMSIETLFTGSSRDAFEGPTWVPNPRPAHLLFTNVPGDVIYKWTPDGKVSVFLDHIFSGDLSKAHRAGDRLMIGANGATLDRQGRLVYTSFSAGQIVRLEQDGKRTVLASEFEGKKINAPNDLIVKSDGSIYFTDSRASSERTSGPECDQWWMSCGNKDGVPHKGVYFLKAGVMHLFSQDVNHPNGLAFSPDEKYLYVANTLVKNIVRFEMKADGTGTNEQIFVDMSGESPEGTLPDGIKVDSKGFVYCTGPGGIWIIAPTGRHIGTIPIPERITNFTFAGNDAKTIYVTGATTLFRILLKVPGPRR